MPASSCKGGWESDLAVLTSWVEGGLHLPLRLWAAENNGIEWSRVEVNKTKWHMSTTVHLPFPRNAATLHGHLLITLGP